MLPFLCLGVLVVSGCGSSSNGGARSSTRGSAPSLPAGSRKPNETIAAFAQRLKTILTTTSCAAARRFQRLTLSTKGISCTAWRTGFLPTDRNFTVVATAAYGTGGVIDFTDAQFALGNSYITAVGPGGAWKIVWILDGGPPAVTVNTRPSSTAPFNSAITQYLGALRKQDCAAALHYTVQIVAPTYCKSLFGSAFQKRLVANPSAQPTPMGGNRFIQFYGLLVDHKYSTLAVLAPDVSAQRGYLVTDPFTVSATS